MHWQHHSDHTETQRLGKMVRNSGDVAWMRYGSVRMRNEPTSFSLMPDYVRLSAPHWKTTKEVVLIVGTWHPQATCQRPLPWRRVFLSQTWCHRRLSTIGAYGLRLLKQPRVNMLLERLGTYLSLQALCIHQASPRVQRLALGVSTSRSTFSS